jgi:hypothetical protein
VDHTDFFTTSAQVLPVAMLALFVEGRVFGDGAPSRQSERIDQLGVLTLLVCAEWTALFALIGGSSGDFAKGVVSLGLGAGFLALIVQPLRRLLRDAAPRLGGWLYPGAVAVLGVLTLLVHQDALPALGIGAFLLAMIVGGYVRAREDFADLKQPAASHDKARDDESQNRPSAP